MNGLIRAFVCCVLLSQSLTTGLAGEVSVDPAEVRLAIEKALPLLDKAAVGSADQRKCFTCHNQAVPAFAFAEAQRRGIGQELSLGRQVQHTLAHLKRGVKRYEQGKGQGGQVLTAGYALWTLDEAGHSPDETTKAVAHYLLQHQKDTPYYSHRGSRPPSSGSDFTATYVALRGLSYFATDDQEAEVEARKEKVREWILSTPAKDTEDRVFRLWSLPYVTGDSNALKQAKDELLKTQREDGGWAQIKDHESDAYATATAMVALLDTGSCTSNDPAIKRGAKFLLDGQQEDGSWHVKTRAKPFQTYFETGFPYKEDQFISVAASAWSTIALLKMLPMEERQ